MVVSDAPSVLRARWAHLCDRDPLSPPRPLRPPDAERVRREAPDHPAIAEDGTTPWPEKFSLEWLEERKRQAGSIIFNAQYQNDTSLMKGYIFRDEWFRFVGAVVDRIVGCLRDFQAVFEEGTPEEKKEFIRLFVEGIELDAEKRVAVCRIKKFPAPSGLDAGKLSLKMVAGAGFEPATFGL